jgi:hypothetical protein
MPNMDYPGPCQSCSAIEGCSTDAQREVAVQSYCKGVEMELNIWKARLYDILADAPKAEDKAGFEDTLNLIKSTVREIEMLNNQLSSECSLDIAAQEKAVGGKLALLRSKYTEALSVISPGYFGG